MKPLAHLFELHALTERINKLVLDAPISAHREHADYVAALLIAKHAVDEARFQLVKVEGKTMDADQDASIKAMREAGL